MHNRTVKHSADDIGRVARLERRGQALGFFANFLRSGNIKPHLPLAGARENRHIGA